MNFYHNLMDGPYSIFGLIFLAIPIIIAVSRGRDLITWLLYVLILPPIAFIHSMVLLFTEQPRGQYADDDDED